MGYCMITFRSVTPVQRAEEVLRRAGIDCTVKRTPKWMEEKGCGYSLRLSCRDIMAATMLLRQAGIAFKKAYSLNENGAPEELRL